jgi:hypothetical protein
MSLPLDDNLFKIVLLGVEFAKEDEAEGVVSSIAQCHMHVDPSVGGGVRGKRI